MFNFRFFWQQQKKMSKRPNNYLLLDQPPKIPDLPKGLNASLLKCLDNYERRNLRFGANNCFKEI